jgi:selenocysteine-specific translation elongation factor
MQAVNIAEYAILNVTKGVGTIVLGMIKQGKVKLHDQLKIMPLKKIFKLNQYKCMMTQ